MSDDGVSGWGWRQNALIRVDSKTRQATYEPEYYAVKHYSHFLVPGSRILSFKHGKEDKLPLMVVTSPEGQYVVFAGNLNENSKELSVKLGEKFLNVTLQAHSLNTFQMK